MDTLKLTNPMMHGPAVKRLQELGDILGCDTGPNDGIFGPATRKAVRIIQIKLGLNVDGICGPKTWAALLDFVDSEDDSEDDESSVFFDIRGKHKKPKLYSRERNWDSIRGITLHQTGCQMPKNPLGWKRLNAHSGTTQEGKFVIVNDPTDMIYHAQGLSIITIGHEIEGNFCGIHDNLKTLWRGGGGPNTLNAVMKLSLDDTFDYYRSEFAKHNQEWSVIYAHRQSSKARRGDPGSEIWKGIAMVWANRLGLETYDGGASWCKKNGLPIPKDWNSTYEDKY